MSKSPIRRPLPFRPPRLRRGGRAPAQPAPAAKPALAQVVILATGGTIAGVQPKDGEAGYKSGAVSVESLIAAVPGIEKLADARRRADREHRQPGHERRRLGQARQRANELLAQPDVDGIVVTHGTDTMEETAYFLNLVLKSDKPVVLVGSMRPATALSADGPLEPLQRGRRRRRPGRAGPRRPRRRQRHGPRRPRRPPRRTRPPSRRSSPSTAARSARSTTERCATATSRPPRARSRANSPRPRARYPPRVDIVYAHENSDGTLVKAAVAAGAKGIVLAGVGDGNATKEMIDALAEAAKAGVVVVRATRVGSGIVRRNIEVNDDKLGFVAAFELNPQKARVLLRLALTKTKDVKEIQKNFEEN